MVQILKKKYLVFLFLIFVTNFETYSKADDSIMYTCEYKSTEYVDDKVYGNESHFLEEYSNVLGWIKISKNEVKLSGIGWSQGMRFVSVKFHTNTIDIEFESIFDENVMRKSKISINRANGNLRENYFSRFKEVSNKYNMYACNLRN